MTKDELRAAMKAQRRMLDSDFIKKASLRISEAVLDIVKDSNCVMLYLSAFKEPDTFGLLNSLHELGIKTVVPVSDTDTCTITPTLLLSPSDLKKGAYGIYEPKETVPVSVSDIDIALIPAVAFSKSGDRLGFGMGYYDRFLAEFKGLKTGIAYDFQIHDEIPISEHDVKMDMIITEKRIYNDF